MTEHNAILENAFYKPQYIISLFFFPTWHFCAQQPEWHLCTLIPQGWSCELWKPWWKLESQRRCDRKRAKITASSSLCPVRMYYCPSPKLTTAKTLLWPCLSQTQIALLASTKCNIAGLKDFLLPFQNLPTLWHVIIPWHVGEYVIQICPKIVILRSLKRLWRNVRSSALFSPSGKMRPFWV